MATNEERLKILTLLQDGAINADQAAMLLEALAESERRESNPRTAAAPAPPPPPVGGRRWLRVRITDTNSGRNRVNVRLPVSMIGAGLKMGMHFAPEVEGLNSERLMEAIRSGEIGQIVDVYDDDDGEHVEVFIE
jgi:hypothetical protein